MGGCTHIKENISGVTKKKRGSEGQIASRQRQLLKRAFWLKSKFRAISTEV